MIVRSSVSKLAVLLVDNKALADQSMCIATQAMASGFQKFRPGPGASPSQA